jgi:hypothetical protein
LLFYADGSWSNAPRTFRFPEAGIPNYNPVNRETLFPAHMVEIQYDRIGFTAIYTRMRFEIVYDMLEKFRRFCAAALPDIIIVDRFMSLIPIVLNLFDTWTALGLQTVRASFIIAKLAQILILLTAWTLFHERRLQNEYNRIVQQSFAGKLNGKGYGSSGIRTLDPMLKRHLLCQLS